MSAVAIPAPLVREHLARLADLLRPTGLAAVVVFHPSNMRAFLGTEWSSSDRLLCGAVTCAGRAVAVCPAFERPALDSIADWTHVATWDEHEDPYATLVRALADADAAHGPLGVDGRMWVDGVERLAAAVAPRPVRNAEALLREVRIIKSPTELDVLREAHRRGERAFAVVAELLRPGVSERELCDAVTARFAPEGLHVVPLVQSGPNAAVPHSPTGARRLVPGDTVVVDSVITWQGYCNDLTRTFAVGEPPARVKAAYRAVRTAQLAAIAAARPGVPCSRLDAIARGVIAEAGFGPYFVHRLGHGIGLEGHEPPYLVGGNDEPLRPGMVCTVEPGIYVPGAFGIRIEDVIIITEGGCEVIRGTLATDVSAALEA